MPRPRDFLTYPAQFGRADPAEWKTVVYDEWPLQQAALLQHDFVREVRHQQERMDQGTSVTADLIQMHADQLRRIYRGEAGLSIENMFKIARTVGIRPRVGYEVAD